MNRETRNTVIAGNWKMNLTPSKAKAVIEELKPLVAGKTNCTTILCVPFVDIATAVEAAKGSDIKIGAQNVHFEEKGAFTGALADRPGLLKKADGGILFLDEIGELGLDEQAMLLRAIEEKKFFPLGTDTESESRFELICGTNRDLEDAVNEGVFRADLLARINLWDFQLPGLAERREDIEPNLEYELECFARKSGKRITFNKEARAEFMRYALAPETAWRGNFRELNALVTRMATLSSGGRIDENIVKNEISRLRKGQKSSSSDGRLSQLLGNNYRENFDEFELCQLSRVIEVCRQSRSRAEAGKKLFAVSRKQRNTTNDSDRLGKYLEKFGLTFQICKNC